MVTVVEHDKIGLTWSSDWHAYDGPLGKRNESYGDDILNKVQQMCQFATKSHSLPLCGGDVFHAKNPQSKGNTFRLVNKMIEIIQTYAPGEVVMSAVGNHDLTADRMDSLPSQPLGSVIASGAIVDITNAPWLITNEDRTISVSVEAYPYADEEVTLARVLAAPERPEVHGKPVTYRVAVLHQYGAPGDSRMMFGQHPNIGYNQLADTDYDLILWGHDHSREEVVKVGKPTHVRFGSLSRASASVDETDRPVVLAHITFDETGFHIKEVPLKVKPLEVAFRMANQVIEKAHKSTGISDFLDEMDVAVEGVQSSDPGEVMDQLGGEDRPTVDLAKELCSIV